MNSYDAVFQAMWAAWGVYWLALTKDVKATRRREPIFSRLLHLVPLALALAMLLPHRLPVAWLNARFIAYSSWQQPVGAALTAAGLLFTIWARWHLGKNWSGIVTLKQGHELICTGPYAIVRHPIYTGLLLAFAGSGLARGDWRAVLAFALVALSLWRKLRLEERWMREQFGEHYQAYSQRVRALIPFVL